MHKTLRRLVAFGFSLYWRGALLDVENLPQAGPAVFVANHLGALGPIAVGAALPRDFYFWIHADLLDPHRAPAYLRRDFLEPHARFPPLIHAWAAAAISSIHIPLLGAVGGVPVYHGARELDETFGRSLRLLTEGQRLLIFPEHPRLPCDLQTHMRPFQKGFTRLGELFYERTRLSLPFIPLAVHASTRTVQVGRPIRYNPHSKPVLERLRLQHALEESVRGMLMGVALEERLRLTLPS